MTVTQRGGRGYEFSKLAVETLAGNEGRFTANFENSYPRPWSQLLRGLQLGSDLREMLSQVGLIGQQRVQLVTRVQDSGMIPAPEVISDFLQR